MSLTYNSNTRAVLFLTVCIPVRMCLAYLSIVLPSKWLSWYGMIFILQSMSFGLLYFTNARLHAGEGGGKTWWAQWRIVHAALLLVGGIMLVRKDKRAIMPLMADPMFGVLFFVLNRLGYQ